MAPKGAISRDQMEVVIMFYAVMLFVFVNSMPILIPMFYMWWAVEPEHPPHAHTIKSLKG